MIIKSNVERTHLEVVGSNIQKFLMKEYMVHLTIRKTDNHDNSDAEKVLEDLKVIARDAIRLFGQNLITKIE